VKALAAISPPLDTAMVSQLRSYFGTALLVGGDRDQFTPSKDLRALADSSGKGSRCLIFEGEDHFWGLKAPQMARAIADFFAKHL